MTIKLPDLPYPHDALEPYISKETLHYHHDKHQKTYVDNLNKLIKDTEFANMGLDQIIKRSDSGPIFNNAAQVWNHTFYWHSMTPPEKFERLSEGKLYDAIVNEWKSVETFEKTFVEKGKKLFGSGWVWLTHKNGKVGIESTHNANEPKNVPIMVCDVWEHAYYLDTKNERPKYIENFFKVTNWDFANKNYET